MWVFAAALAVPVIEIALFILVGGAIGVWPTIGLVVLSAVAGVMILRNYGRIALAGVQQTMARGEDPGEALFGSAMMLMAAGLFIVPGFLTDAMALALLIPPLRALVYRAVVSRLNLRASAVMSGFEATQPGRPAHPQDIIIEGEFEDVTTPKRPTHEPSGWTRH